LAREEKIQRDDDTMAFVLSLDKSLVDALIKKINFPHILGNSEGSGAKSYMTNDLLTHIW
jgi:hypothetical protein